MIRKNLQYALLAVAMLSGSSAVAQESQKMTANKLNDYGLIYSLPVTHFNIEVEAVRTIKKAGPYFKYAKKYLGVTDIIKNNSQSWDVTGVSVSSYGVPNKDNEYLMQLKSGAAPFLMLDGEGLPLSINIEAKEEVVKRKRNKLADKSVLDGIDYLSAVSEDMVASESMMKRAEAAAAKIFELRESRNDLVSGRAEQTPPDGASLKLMLDELNRQEAILTAMFVGTTQKETKVFRFDYVPTADVQNEIAFRVSDFNGIVDKNDLSGEPVYLNLKVTQRGELPVNEKGEVKQTPKGAVMYCIPGKAQVSLSYMGKELASETLSVAQFGVEYGLEPKIFTNKKAPAYVIFEPETGGIKEIGTLEVEN